MPGIFIHTGPCGHDAATHDKKCPARGRNIPSKDARIMPPCPPLKNPTVPCIAPLGRCQGAHGIQSGTPQIGKFVSGVVHVMSAAFCRREKHEPGPLIIAAPCQAGIRCPARLVAFMPASDALTTLHHQPNTLFPRIQHCDPLAVSIRISWPSVMRRILGSKTFAPACAHDLQDLRRFSAQNLDNTSGHQMFNSDCGHMVTSCSTMGGLDF